MKKSLEMDRTAVAIQAEAEFEVPNPGGNMGCYGMGPGNGLNLPPNTANGESVFLERTADEWAKDWARSRQRALATGPPDSIGPFGLLCFGMTTCMLMFVLTTWAEGEFVPQVVAYAAAYGGLGQLIAGVLEMIKGNTFAGTAFSSYGCFWLGFALVTYLEEAGTVPSVTTGTFTGSTLFYCLWGILTSVFYIVSLRKNGCLQTIFLSLLITFFLLAGGNYNPMCQQAAGYIGFFCGASAIYAASAMLLKAEMGWILPGMRATRYC